MPDHEVVHVGPHEAQVRVVRGADDRLAAHVERRVDDDRHAGDRARTPGSGRSRAAFSSRVTVCSRAEPSTWVTDGDARACPRAPAPPAACTGLSQSMLEPLARLVGEHAGREGAEALPELDLHVQGVVHLRVAGVGEDAAAAEGARPELHPSLEPADDVACSEMSFAVSAQELLVRERPVLRARAVQVLRDLGCRCTRGRGTRGSSPCPGAACGSCCRRSGRRRPRRLRRPPRAGPRGPSTASRGSPGRSPRS